MFECTWDDPHVFGIAPFALHGVRLAAAGLALGEDGPVEPS